MTKKESDFIPPSNSGDGPPDGPTPYEKKCKELKDLYDSWRLFPSDFSGRPNYTNEEIEKATRKIDNKQAGRVQRGGEALGADDLDKVFESIIYYAGNRGQIFAQEGFSEPGNEYDDEFHGADIVFGLPQKNGERDVVFNVDACTATDLSSPKNKIIEKFQRSIYYAFEDSPHCNKLDYYAHENTRTRITQSPHYIIGITPAHVQKAVDALDLRDDSISGTIPDDLRKKILLELFYQSDTGIRACENVRNKTNHTEKALKGHTAVREACVNALYSAFQIDPKTKGAAKELDRQLQAFEAEHAKNDDTFSYILKISKFLWGEQKKLKDARKAVEINDTLNGKKTDPNPEENPKPDDDSNPDGA